MLYNMYASYVSSITCHVSFVQEYEDVRQLKSLIQRHLKFTGSQVARKILLNWEKERPKFVKVGHTPMGCWNTLSTSLHGCRGQMRCIPALVHTQAFTLFAVFSN